MTARSRTLPTAAVLVACGSLALAAAPALADTAPVRTVGVVTADGTGGAWTYNSAELPAGARMVVTATYPTTARRSSPCTSRGRRPPGSTARTHTRRPAQQ